MKKNLITDKNEFWESYDKRTKYFFKLGSYSDSGLVIGGNSFTFLKNGECIAYSGYSERKKKRTKVYSGDLIVDETWKLKGDSMLVIQHAELRIVYYKKDSFTLQNPITGDTTWLYKVRNKP